MKPNNHKPVAPVEIMPTPAPEPAAQPDDDPLMLQMVESMNLMAARVWDMQSESLSTAERTRRIKAALLDQGYSDEDMAMLQLPVIGFERYL